MVGTFDKPKYINFIPDLCVYLCNILIGCTRCLNLCLMGAIIFNGDIVVIDFNICVGCGQCAVACLTGAAVYVLLVTENIAVCLCVGLAAYFAVGGKDVFIVLFYDVDYGAALIDVIVWFGKGLPVHVIPV